MQLFLSFWTALDPRRRLVAAAAAVATVLAVLGLTRMAATPDMALLYSGLDAPAAGEVVQALDQQGVAYDVRGGAIFVPQAQRDTLRMTLAGQGLPANATQGYELLDSLTGFGTTAQMFDAAYWRAKEGELARTITAAPDIRAARVHIANPTSSPFQRGAAPTASVTVTAAGALDGKRAMALRYLVASAVAGLTPEGVSVIDGRTGFVVAGEDVAGAQGQSGDRAAALKTNIERLLEARVGPGKAVVEVSVETVTEREAISERLIDPETRVAISEEVRERAASSNETGTGGGVTVASNLPEGDAAAGDGQAQSNDTETRETVNYEVSETRREILREPGAIKRISVAVLVDGMRRTDSATGATVWEPRPEDEIAALRDLVAGAVGFDADRGDEITLRSMEFLTAGTPDAVAAPGWFRLADLDAMRLIQLGVLAAVALTLGLFVVRPVLARSPAAPQLSVDRPGAPVPAGLPVPRETGHPPLPTVAAAAQAAELGHTRIDEGPPADTGHAAGSAAERADAAGSGDGAAPSANALAPAEPGAQDPVARLRRLIDERQDETVEILRSWMEDREEKA